MTLGKEVEIVKKQVVGLTYILISLVAFDILVLRNPLVEDDI